MIQTRRKYREIMIKNENASNQKNNNGIYKDIKIES